MDDFCGSVFWDSNLTWYTTDPDFTECFQKTVLVWVPCGFLFLVSPVYIYLLSQSQDRTIKHTWLSILKTTLSIVLAGACLANLIWVIQHHATGSPLHLADIFAPSTYFLSMILSAVLIQVCRKKGRRSSAVLFIYWFFLTVTLILVLVSKIKRIAEKQGPTDLFHLVTFSILGVGAFTQLVLAVFVDAQPQYYSVVDATEEKLCPEETASFLSMLTFWWFTGLIIKGYKRALERKDLWRLNTEDYSKAIVPRFEFQWNKEICKAQRSEAKASQRQNGQYDGTLECAPDSQTTPLNPAAEAQVDIQDGRTKKPYQPSLVKAIAKTFWKTFLSAGLLKLCSDILTFINPQLLRLMINYVSPFSEDETWKGYLYAFSMFTVALIQSFILHQYFHHCFTVGMKLRTAIVASIYKKSLRLSNSARRGASVGEITNLMAVDAQRFMDVCTNINMIWSAPFQMCVALYFLWLTLGPSVLAGLGVMLLMLPINAFIAKKTRTLQVEGMMQKDSRIKLMNEILNGMKVLKLYAWEASFQEKVLGIRNAELAILKRAAYLNAATSFTWTCAPFLVSLTTFAVYVLSSEDNILDAEKAFVALSLFNILRFPMSMLPQLIASLVQVSVSIKRLHSYLRNEELNPKGIDRDENVDTAIRIEKGVFAWDREEEVPTLPDIDLSVKEGALVAVVGTVGSGKSSLLAAMLGEMEKINGSVNVKGNIAHVAQQAWIQNATLKDNIMFGKPMEECLYYKVLDACALVPDLSMLAAGDMTEIGEKGINLSGGQKQRVSVARAVYADRDVYLFDDPLSAVDSHVGKHIFDEVIGPNSLLKNKTRVLVTHGISFLPKVDQIIVLVDGQVSEQGSYKELLAQGGAFADFLRNYLIEEEEEDEEELDEETRTIREEILSHIGSMDGLDIVPRTPRTPMTPMTPMSGSPSSRPPLIKQKSSVQFSTQPPHQIGRQMSLRTSRPMNRQLSRQLSRQTSVMSVDSHQEETPAEKKHRFSRQITIADDECHPPDALMGRVKEVDKLIKAEGTETGSVKMSVFLSYMKSVGLPVSMAIILFYILSNMASVGSNFWLSAWSNEGTKQKYGNASESNSTKDNRDLYLGVYGALGLSQGICILLAALTFANGRVLAAYRLHQEMLINILRSPLHFFDSTPMGRITNRFSKDIDMIDQVIPATMTAFLMTFLSSLSSVVVISVSTPWFLAILLPLIVLYLIIQRFYVATSRQLKRLESVSRSPIYSHFGETIQGAVTIRAYNQQNRFVLESERKVDENQCCYYPNIVANRWLAVRLEFVGNCIVLAASLFAVIGRDSLSPGIVGLSVSYAMTITATLNMMVRMTSELESNIVAVERVKEYSETPREAPWEIEEHRPDGSWPAVGQVEIVDYSTRYRPGLDLVVRDVSCKIKGGEMVGIVGRTGAGKSSLTLALFRIIEPASGTIHIDGLNITEMGLHDLRSKLTIIPQDPVLFSGSLRMNLDPFDTYTDDALWKALEHAHLKDFVASLPEELSFMCSEGGENLSVGQRQLVCLARALLRHTKVLILDEATAAVDLETDDLIQSTIRTQFAGSTVLTIAHRLNTIMDYTRILVLDAGRVSEFDTPTNLIARRGIFHGMAKDAGLAD